MQTKTRKIIQIAVSGEDLFALCDDGTLWHHVNDPSHFGWEEFTTPDIQLEM
jgi:hypothetical protein